MVSFFFFIKHTQSPKTKKVACAHLDNGIDRSQMDTLMRLFNETECKVNKFLFVFVEYLFLSLAVSQM